MTREGEDVDDELMPLRIECRDLMRRVHLVDLG
jgi:hypothetical protein